MTEQNPFAAVFANLSAADPLAPHSESGTVSLGPDDRSEAVEATFDELLTQVVAALPTDEVSFDEDLVKANLEEILLLCIALHGETHGKQLLADLSRLFNAQLSPGTVYPSLHDLEEAGLLSMHTKVRTKEYSIDDQAAVRQTLEEAMIQHLTFGMVLYAVLSQ